jgi:type I restriction enzyme S subunit
MSGNIPEGWAEKPLNDLVDFLDGQRRPIKSADRNHMRGPYPYYGASGIIDWVNDYLFDDDLILLGEDGENILSRNLPLAFAVSGKIWVNNHAHVLRPKAGVDLPFLTQLLDFQDYADLNSGTAQPKLNLQSCKNFKLILPKTLPEQQAIAAALSDADAVVAGLERVIAKKRLIKQGAMQDLLTARRRLPGFSGDWEVKRLGDVARFGKGKGLPKSDVLSAGPYECVHYGSLFREQPAVITHLDTYSTRFGGAVFSDTGDVLMPTSDVTPSGLAVASCITKADVILGGDILIIKPDAAALNGEFLSSVIRSSKTQIMGLVSGTTVFHIYAGDMARFTFKAPGLDEQQAVAAVLSDMDAEIQTLESRLAKARAVKEGMMQNLLTGRVRLV